MKLSGIWPETSGRVEHFCHQFWKSIGAEIEFVQRCQVAKNVRRQRCNGVATKVDFSESAVGGEEAGRQLLDAVLRQIDHLQLSVLFEIFREEMADSISGQRQPFQTV